MSHTTTVEIDGAPVAINATSPWPTRLNLRLRGVSTLTLSLMGAKLGDPDPYIGKPIVLKIDGDAVFAGDVVDAPFDFSDLGWGKVYQCRDLRARGDKVPFTDSNSLGAYATYNYDAEDPDKIDARLGRTVGQILQDVLTMQDNADGLDAYGIGGYTSLGPPTLPAATLADLAAMTVIPPNPVRIGGECLLRAIAGFLSQWAPNHAMWVRPDGVIRFLDQRAPTEHVLTLDDCGGRIEPPSVSRSVAECFQRVLVRGKAVAMPKLLTLLNGGLVEDFAWGVLDNAGAKAAWTPEEFLRDQNARSIGTCSCTDTTHVVLTSTPGTQTWGSNEWDQSHRRGMLYVWSTTNTGYDKFFASRVVSNTSKSSGGTSTFTLETPLPDLTFNNYILRGLSSGASLVWRKYKAADSTIAASLARRFTYPVPYVNAGGSAASLTSYPQASVVWSLPGSTTPLEFFDPIVAIDLANGTFLLGTPTYNYSNAPPTDVRILAAVNTGVLTAVKPASGYEGTSHTDEGLEDTLTITLDSWRDPANQANVEAFAQDVLDSVKDAVTEGSVTIRDLFAPGLTFGLGLSFDASSYDTGWETLNVPVTEVELTWNSRAGSASHYTTRMQFSSRRASCSAAAYLQPERRAADGTLGVADGLAYQGAAGAAALPSPVGYSGDGGDDGSAVLGLLDSDQSAPGGNVSGRYGRAAKYSAAKPFATTNMPYSTARKFASRSEGDRAAERARAREKRQAESDARRAKGASRADVEDIRRMGDDDL